MIVDNIGRTLLWCRVAPEFGPWISCLEWATFSCTHTLGSGWKFDFGSAPTWVMRVMANGFYSAVGVWGIAGLHCMPLLIYLQGHMEALEQVTPAAVLAAADLTPAQMLDTATVRNPCRHATPTPTPANAPVAEPPDCLIRVWCVCVWVYVHRWP